jgi:uncharacterized protein (DUF1697 family)
MAVFVALLRGVNVSGQKKVPMADLKAVYRSLGFVDVTTYIQTGNVIFRAPAADQARIEAAQQAAFGFHIPVVLRARDEFREVIGGNPFAARRGIDSSRLHVTFLAAAPDAAALAALAAVDAGREEHAVRGREVYLHCPDGYGRAKLNNNFLEARLGGPATTRNWKTVNALLALADGFG